MADIAERAGVSKASLFQYFGTKNALYLYLYRYSVDEILSRISEGSEDFFECISAASVVKMDVLAKHPGMFDFMASTMDEESPKIAKDLKALAGDRIGHGMSVLFAKVDWSRFKPEVNREMAVNAIAWMSEGYIRSALGHKAAEAMRSELAGYMELLKGVLQGGMPVMHASIRPTGQGGRNNAMAVIKIEHMEKRYGRHIGTRDVTFSVDEGEIFGFVGPNGAGKTTTLKVLMGFVLATGGSASICGLDVEKDTRKIKTFTGYVPSDVRLYASMRVKELLRRNAAFYRGDCAPEADRLCELFETDVNKRFHELSSGNKKKVSIICALMSKPKIIILDEPTSGLDPVMQKMLFGELKRQTADGATVLLSSHNLTEVQEYCHRVAFIKDGTILAVTDLTQSAGTKKILAISGGCGTIPEGLELIKEDGDKRLFRSGLKGGALLNALTEIGPDDFTVENESMEERFWGLYGQEENQ